MARWWRSHLGIYFLRNVEGDIVPKRPVDFYDVITQQQWYEFVEIRCSEEFRAVSEKNSQSAGSNPYPYMRGRNKYADLEHKMLTADPNRKVDRCDLWLEDHTKKDGTIHHDSVKAARDRAIELKQGASGEIPSHGQDDLLGRTLGRPESTGRVRGKGFGVLPSQFFKEKLKSHQTSAIEKQYKVLWELYADLQEQVNEIRSGRGQGSGHQSHAPSAHESPVMENHSCTMESVPIPEGESYCQLYSDLSLNTLVALAYVFNDGSKTLHNSPLPAGTVRVSIHISLRNNSPLPYPIDGMNVVVDAIGSFVAWPKKWMVPQSEPEKGQRKELGKTDRHDVQPRSAIPTKPRKKSLKPTLTRVTQPHPSESFRVKLKNLTKQLPDFQQIEVKLTRTIYYKSVSEHLGSEVIMDVVNQEWISASAINIWIKYLHDEIIVPGENVNFAFIDPNTTSMVTETTTYWDEGDVKARLGSSSSDKTLFLAPVNVGNHWVLLAFNPVAPKPVVYYLDPIRSGKPENRPSYMMFINGVITSCRSSKKMKYSKAYD